MPPTVSIEPPEVFVDSGAFIALCVPGDAYHQAAIACKEQTLKFSRLYTSSVVVSETVAHIQRDHLLDPNSLSDLISDFQKAGGWLSFLHFGDEVLMEGLRMVKDRNDRRFSLVDATNIILMEKHGIDIIFSYDGFYDGVSLQRGYTTRLIRRIGQ